jgi:TRAP-type C4-dicarboxylate transport system permease small subunit
MRKVIVLQSLLLTILIVASPVFAQSTDVDKIQSFIKNIIQILVTVSGLTAVGFFVWGGFRYMTSTGSPDHMDQAKKTIVTSGIGLAIVLGAYVMMNIVTQVATNAFGQ